MNMFFLSVNGSRGENRLFEGQRPSWIHREGHGLFLRSLEIPLSGDLTLNSPTNPALGYHDSHGTNKTDSHTNRLLS